MATTASSSSSSTLLGRRRGPQAAQSFMPNWHEQYLMYETTTGCVCMLCGSEFTIIRRAMLERHYSIAHGAFDLLYPIGSNERQAEIKELMGKYTRSTSPPPPAITVVRDDELAIARVSLRIAEVTRDRNSPDGQLNDGEFLKTALLDCAGELLHAGDIKEKLVQALELVPVTVCPIEPKVEPDEVTETTSVTLAPTVKRAKYTEQRQHPLPRQQQQQQQQQQSPHQRLQEIQQENWLPVDSQMQLESVFARCSWYSLTMVEYKDKRSHTKKLVAYARLVYDDRRVEEHYLHAITLLSTTCAVTIARAIRNRLGRVNLEARKLVGFTLNRNWRLCDDFLREYKSSTELVHRYCLVGESIRCLNKMPMESIARVINGTVDCMVTSKTAPLNLHIKVVEPALRCKQNEKERPADQVRWLRYSSILSNYLDSIPQIMSAISKWKHEYLELWDPSWIHDLAFLVNFAGEFEDLLTELRKPDRAIWEHVKALGDFREKLEIWILSFQMNQIGISFPRLKAVVEMDDSLQTFTGDSYALLLRDVLAEFDAVIAQYPDVNAFITLSKDLFNLPKVNRDELIMALRGSARIEPIALFNEIVAFSNDPKFYRMARCGGDIWADVNAYRMVNVIYRRLLSAFGTTYLNNSKIDTHLQRVYD